MEFVSVTIVGGVVIGAMLWAVFGAGIVDSFRTHNFWDD